MNISNLILAGNYVEAKNQISERLNEIALGLMESAKEVYAQHLFNEEFDTKFKGKTDMDFVKDAKKEGDDEGDGDAPHGEMPVGDEQVEGESEEPEKDEGEEESDEEPDGDENEDKPAKNIKAGKGENINITVNEGVVPVAKGKPSQDGVGKGAAENPSWKKKARAFLAKGPNKVTGPANVSEEAAHELHEVSKAMADRYLSKNGNDMAKQWNAGNDRKVSNRLKGTARATRIMQGVKLSSKKLTEGEDK